MPRALGAPHPARNAQLKTLNRLSYPINYVVQLATVVPMTLNGTLGEFRLLDQTPHSLMWDLDALGYIFMGLATAFAVPVLSQEGLEGWARRFFLAHTFMTPVIAFVYFYPGFSTSLLLIGSPWLITAPGAALTLALVFRRRLHATRNEEATGLSKGD